MSNNINENQTGFDVEAVYPFFNEIVSADKSVVVSNSEEDSSEPVDLKVNLELHASLLEVLEFAEIDNSGDATTEPVEDKTRYLKLNSQRDSAEQPVLKPGILCVLDATMKTLPYPEVPAVLVVNKEGKPKWIEVPNCPNGDDYALGTYNGDWYWYHIESCGK